MPENRYQQSREQISHMQVLFKGDIDADAEDQHIAHQREIRNDCSLLQKWCQEAGPQRDRALLEKQRDCG